MSTSDTSPHQPQRTSATVRDRDVAAQIVVDLAERGIARERVTTRDLDPAEGVASPRETGEADLAFTESTGKNLGAGWLIAFLIGAVVGVIGCSLLFEPPWASPLAAGINLAVAIGVGYIAGAMGFIQSGLARAGESGGEQLSEGGRGHGTRASAGGPPEDSSSTTRDASSTTGAPAGHTVEVIVEAATPDEARTAEAVFAEHRADPTR